MISIEYDLREKGLRVLKILLNEGKEPVKYIYLSHLEVLHELGQDCPPAVLYAPGSMHELGMLCSAGEKYLIYQNLQ